MKPSPRTVTTLKVTVITAITLACIFIPTLSILILPAALIYWISQKISTKLNHNNQPQYFTPKPSNKKKPHTYTPPKPLTPEQQQQQWNEITDNLKNNH